MCVCMYSCVHMCVGGIVCTYVNAVEHSCLYMFVYTYVKTGVFVHVYVCVCRCLNINSSYIWRF